MRTIKLLQAFQSVLHRLLAFILLLGFMELGFGQTIERPEFASGKLTESLDFDGALNEEDWKNAPVLTNLKTTVPEEGGIPSQTTLVQVIADARTVVIGITCNDSNPDGIIRFSKLRDADISEEDHVKVVIDPFLDGQSGYIFAVNSLAARYDALVSDRGEDENEDWDAVWDAKTQITERGWTAEIVIPIQSIAFKKGLSKWGFNIERRIQRNLETIRWANVKRDQWIAQTSRAGVVTGLPEFNYGVGINIRPSLIANANQLGPDRAMVVDPDVSLDANQRIGPNVLATFTLNTDFGETEVDTRQTNLTRFPLFFPERRIFFLEGSDIFEFGFGTGTSTVLPFFSRRIGLRNNVQIPVVGGTKLNGRIGKTAFGGLGIRTDDFSLDDDSFDATNMGVVRVRRNVLKESSVGFIASSGDPLGRDGSWMSGGDFTFQTTRFKGDKNFLVGGWALFTDRGDLSGDRSAAGFKIDYPNDRWDVAVTYARIGEQFDPSLGFVPRQGVNFYRFGGTFAPRPKTPWLRQMFHQFFVTYINNISGPWQSYSVFTAPINWRLESGDRIEANVRPTGENILVPFDISEGVTIPVGEYNFMRYRLEAEFARKRRLSGQATWWFGSFYEGTLDEFELTLNWNPSALLAFEFNGLHNRARLPFGDFDQSLAGLRVRFNVTSNLQLNSYLQYDTDSRVLGLNARIHWIFSSLGDVFLVFNNNTINNINQPWELQNRQILLKVRYNFRL
ncbi:carbohydrate binding family 9 domain-containing protein [Muricauda sp. SCSIO 64092]|uniref:carbohydrate binding family 9 domain-containing protein n=1 Tax=Allomuricauda sp. SCSIO 64092 TaxID=2908842 RepID=UPI001FF63BE8|nr:carbohydrate binding family 9 domain-containing protein [Muricauda sp. SCSIO 64092]UOY07052.1 carbohydrate binding family 9 domain-containing protein [Muricauda sp. SCSIO 64092]